MTLFRLFLTHFQFGIEKKALSCYNIIYGNRKQSVRNRMRPIEIVGQIISIIAVIITFLTYQMRSSRAIMATLSAATLVSCVAYAMLGGATALWLNLVGIIRNILYCFHRKNKILYTSLPILLALIMTVMSVFLWEDYHSLFFVVGLALNTLAMGYFNPQNLRKSLLLTSSLILIYNLFIPSIGGTINEFVAISSAVIGLIRYRKQKDIAASES